ncbi:head-tail connector protein [uncultured Mediterranean phage uvMED]|nr:head-tail connector protein [uncultured Mediterranean phage uvMED]
MNTFDYIKKRCSKLEAERQTWEDHWQDILDYVMPRKADVTFVRSKGEKRTEVLYDSTAITANNLLAASLQGTLTSASLPWFHLKLRDTELNEDREVQLWLEDSAKRMYETFNESNFNTEVHELYLDLVSIGTGAIFVEEGNKGFEKEGIHFNCLHIAEYFIQENINGKVDTLYRKYKLTARQAIQEFGEENVGEKILESVKDKPDKQFNFIHAVEPTEDYERAVGEVGTKLPVHSCHVCIEDKMKVRTGGYNEFPYLVPRWSKATGEIFGRSPSYNALPDIKTLNKAVEIGLKAWAKAIDPPLLVQDDGVIGRVRMTPAGITVVRNDGAIKPLQIGSNWQITDMKENQLRTAIRQAYYSDQLQLQDGPQMTATEVQVRYELMQRLLGPTLGRFQSEFLNPLIERTFGIMFRAGALLPEPDVIKGQQIDVEYVGPLARSQRMEEAVAIERLYQLAMNVVQVDPSIMDNINHDEAIRLRSTLLGVPKIVLRGKDEVQEMREARAEEQQAMAEAQAQQQQGQAMESQAKAAKEMSDPKVQEMMQTTQEDMGVAPEEMM